MKSSSFNFFDYCKKEYAIFQEKKENNRFFEQAFKTKPNRKNPFLEIFSKNSSQDISTKKLSISFCEKNAKSKSLNKALADVEFSLTLGETIEKVHLKADILKKSKKYSQAITAFQRVIEMTNNDRLFYVFYFEIANCYTKINQPLKANAFFKYALDLKNQKSTLKNKLDFPKKTTISYEDLYLHKASSEKQLANYSTALADIQEVFKHNKKQSFAYLLTAKIHEKTGNEKLYLSNLKKAADLKNQLAIEHLTILKKHDISNLKLELEQCYNLIFKENKFKPAEKIAFNLYDKGVDDLKIYVCLAALYFHKKNWKQAEIHSIYGLGIDAKNRILLKIIGLSKCEQKDIDSGLVFLLEGKKLGDKNCSTAYDLWFKKA